MKKLILALAFLLAACSTPTITPSVTETPAPAVTDTPVVQPSAVPSLFPTLPASQCQIRGILPDPNCTPGFLNSDVTQSTINQTICVSGWTARVRPPVSYTEPLKIKQIAEYGYSDTSVADYEEDHLIPLELGGNPTDPRNLWPEPRYGTPSAANKDSVENLLKSRVCAGTMSLADARNGIATDWTQFLSGVSTLDMAVDANDQ